MMLRRFAAFAFALALCFVFGGGKAFSERAQPTVPDNNTVLTGYLDAIVADTRVQNIFTKFIEPGFAKERFKEHMEVVRISSPSRQEIYRGIEMEKRFKAAGFNGAPNSDYYTVFSVDGVMPGAAINIVDGLPVWNACAVVKGSTPDSVVDNVTIFSRPKVVIEGHIDTVNPASIDASVRDGTIPAHVYDKIRIAPASDSLVNNAAELAAITTYLNFDENNKIIEDENFNKAYQRFDNITHAKENGGYRIYIPGYSDAMNNTMNVYQMAKLVKESGIKPVQDIWFCATSGEEGRGNLVGMKQLYGYNQQFDTTDNSLKGKNSLNIVANLSIDGSNLEIHYLGSYRYEVNYKEDGTKGNAAMAAARAVAGIAELRSPSEIDNAKPKTTYTVGIVYPASGNGAKDTSFEIDMRSPVPETLIEMRDAILPFYQKGANDENTAKGASVVQSVKWFGDRPAHRRNFDLMATDPLIYAGWKSYEMANGKTMTLPQYPQSSTSLNDNIPAAMGIPSVNLNIGVTAAGGNGHAFNEWGIPGNLANEQKNFKRVFLTLFAVAGMNKADNTNLVPAAYPNIAPRHVNGATDNWLSAQ